MSKNTTELYPGFPEKVAGEMVFCDDDNINTDGVHPGKYTYQDNVPVGTMAKVCMEKYDPKFSGLAKEGDIRVPGFLGRFFSLFLVAAVHESRRRPPSWQKGYL